MGWEVGLSVVAIGVSVGSLMWNVLWSRDMRRRNTHYANATLLAEVELSLKDIPGALKFRGITERELAAAGVTVEELSYLTANILAGWLLYEAVESNCRKPFERGHYRYKLFQSEHTQKAWPLVKRILEHTPFMDRIDGTIEAIRRNQDTIVDGPRPS
ncbi:MAG: hypothetical protein GF355_17635 [Candidatus Eisenbacteria bacterium]|nr:hypothetical protein [Candidatus Eisenbacteria bacterium]